MNIPVSIKPLTTEPVLVFSKMLDCWFIGRWNAEKPAWEVSTSISSPTFSNPDPHIWHTIEDVYLELTWWQALPSRPIDQHMDYCARPDCHHLKSDHSPTAKKLDKHLWTCHVCACPGFLSARVRQNFGELVSTMVGGLIKFTLGEMIDHAGARSDDPRPAPLDRRRVGPLIINPKRKKKRKPSK